MGYIICINHIYNFCPIRKFLQQLLYQYFFIHLYIYLFYMPKKEEGDYFEVELEDLRSQKESLPTEATPSALRKSQKESLPTEDRNWRLLLTFIQENDGEKVRQQILKMNKKEIDLQDGNGETALMHAISYLTGSNIIKILLDAGVNVNLKDSFGKTALMHALAFDTEINVIELLLDAGADVNIQNRDGTTALMQVSKFFNFELKPDKKILELLVYNSKGGANVNLQDEYLKTALMYAAKNPTADDKICKILGGTVTYKRSMKFLKKMYRTVFGTVKTVDLQDEDGKTAFMHSCDSVIESHGKPIPSQSGYYNFLDFMKGLKYFYEPDLLLQDNQGNAGYYYMNEAQQLESKGTKEEKDKEFKKNNPELLKDENGKWIEKTAMGGNRIITRRKRVEKRKKRNTHKSMRFKCAKM